MNPMFLNSTRNADQAAAHTDTLLASTNAPNEAEWKVIRTQYKIQAAELKTAKQQLQKFEDAGGRVDIFGIHKTNLLSESAADPR